MVHKKRQIGAYCLVLFVQDLKINLKAEKAVNYVFKDNGTKVRDASDLLKNYIIFNILLTPLIAITWDALNIGPDNVPILFLIASFNYKFHEIGMPIEYILTGARLKSCGRLVCSLHLMILYKGNNVREASSSTTSNDLVNSIFLHNIFQVHWVKIFNLQLTK